MAPGTEIYSTWNNNTNPCWWRDSGLRKCTILCILMCFGTYTIGYDGSLLSGLQALDSWNEYFDSPSGNRLGLISASAYIPGIFLTPVYSWSLDKFGRRFNIIFGAVGVIVGAIVGALSKNVGMFIAGRVIIGAATNFASISCIAMISELAHPRLRGVSTALYLTCYYTGSILASWLTFGMVHWYGTSWNWRTPTLFQAVGPVVLILTALVCPESPRWLIARGEVDKAHKILADLHANGLMTDQLVENELEEIIRAIDDEKKNSTSWASLFATPGNRKRMVVLTVIGAGTQLNGNGIVTYYLAPILRSIGITDSTTIAGLLGGLSIWNWALAILGALNADRVGRRPLWLTSSIGMLISFIVITGLSAGYDKTHDKAMGSAVVAFLFIFYGAYDLAWTPLSYSYTVEILPFGIRAKGMSYFAMVASVCSALNQWVNPVALSAIGWKYYIVYIGLIALWLVLAYFLFIETKGYTAEEVAVLFDGDQKVLELATALPDKVDVLKAEKGSEEHIE